MIIQLIQIVIFQNQMHKQSSSILPDLTIKYNQWKDMLAKGRLRMKKKTNKQGTNYYDFDYSRYQYYYSFPQTHISMAPPETQKQFINQALSDLSQDFSNAYFDQTQAVQQLERILHPYEYHRGLWEIKKEFEQRISTLRIEKSLRLAQMKDSLLRVKHEQKSLIELIDAEIRSYNYKLIKISDILYCFGESTTHRVQSLKSGLKTRMIDELQIGNIDKAEIIAYLRARQTKQNLSFNIRTLANLVSNIYNNQSQQIKGTVLKRRASKIKAKKQKINQWKEQIQKQIEEEVDKIDRSHFETIQNKEDLVQFVQSLDYITVYQQTVKRTTKIPYIHPRQYTLIQLNYDQHLYRPKNRDQLMQRFKQKCCFYFPKLVMEQSLLNSTDEHISYKINSLCFLQLKVLWETYDLASKYEEASSLIKIRKMMKMELNLVFSNSLDKLLNLREHSLKTITHEKWLPELLHKYVPKSEKQAIMEQQLKNQKRFRDPFIVSYLNLLDVKRDTVVRQEIQNYAEKVAKSTQNVLNHQRIYYENCYCDDQKHLINILNHYASLNHSSQNPNLHIFIKALSSNSKTNQINENLLYTHYLLVFLRSSENKYRLLEVLNGQISCMIKVQSRLKFLWKKSQIPFSMTKQFMTRFTENSDSNTDGFDFLNHEACDEHLEMIFKELETNSTKNDLIVLKNNLIEVQRQKSSNLLLEGKSIIFVQAFQDLEDTITRIQFLCSETIKFRQLYLPDGKISCLVDRFELIFSFLEHQLNFQKAKLNLLQQYCQLLLQTPCPQGITEIYKEMNQLKKYNYIADLSQPQYLQSYQAETKALEYKYKLLCSLKEKQRQFEKQSLEEIINNKRRANFSNKEPELSSFYFVEEISADKDIIEEVSEQNLSQSMVSEAFEESQNKQITIGSEISSLIDASQYHLKTNFQEVLSKNSLDKIKEENSKKQELMNRKKQIIINDSILGAYLPRSLNRFEQLGESSKKSTNYFYSTYYVIEIMNKIDECLLQHSLDPQFSAAFIEALFQNLKDYTFQKYNAVVKPDQLPLALNGSHRVLQKFMEKAKGQGINSSRNQTDHFLLLPSEIINNYLANETGPDIDQMRGLYISLNILHLNEVYYQEQVVQNSERTNFGITKYLNKIISQYSGINFESVPILKSDDDNLENAIFNNFKLLNNLKQNRELYYLGIGNYIHYFKALSAFKLSKYQLASQLTTALHQQCQCISSLITELELLFEYQCCTPQIANIELIPNLHNKVFLNKKIEFLKSYQRSIIKKQVVENIVEFLQNQIMSMKQSFLIQPRSSGGMHSLSSMSENFEKFIFNIVTSAIQTHLLASEIGSHAKYRQQINLIQTICKVLPQINRNLIIQPKPKTILTATFPDHAYLFPNNDQANNNGNIILKYMRFNPKSIIQQFDLSHTSAMRQWINTYFFTRTKKQFKYQPKIVEYLKYSHRYSLKNIAPNQSTLITCFKGMTYHQGIYRQSKKLRIWLQIQTVLYGCTLKPDQLHRYRKMLINPYCSFPIFWNNNSSNLISVKNLHTLRTSQLASKEIIQQYIEKYQNYHQLRKKYHQFLQDLYEFHYEQELSDSLLILYSGCKPYFTNQEYDWNFIFNYATSQHKISPNKVDSLMAFIYHRNPASLSGNPYLLWGQYGSKDAVLQIDKIKFYAWNQDGMATIQKNDEIRRFIKYQLNENKAQSAQKVENQVAYCYYKKERLKQLLKYLNLDPATYPLLNDDFILNFQKYIHDGEILLTPEQRNIFYLTQKNKQSQNDFNKVKDQIMQVIITNNFWMKLIKEQFYRLSIEVLEGELELREILLDNHKNEDLVKDQLIMKQTINKILIPKVKLNPFLSSPLKFENYFFSGSAKLAYIDQFLNKLRNRAVLIELAEGGTGFLLKVNQLDQSVEFLCKAIIGFSEKEFSDRLRTIYESYHELIQEYNRQKVEKKRLRTIIDSMKDQERKETITVTYGKLTEYLVRFHEHDKQFNVIINLLKSLENRCKKQVRNQYQNSIDQLKTENQMLKQNFQHFKKQLSFNYNSEYQQTKDFLFQKFKDQAENVLNKSFIQGTIPELKHDYLQLHDSTLLLQKLRKQKIFYEMKVNKIQSHFEEKLNLLQAKITEQNKLQNLLNIEEEKVKHLTEEIKLLQKCSIENQVLKKQIMKKDEEQSMSKFRLIKVNDSLKGKLHRINEDHQRDNRKLLNRIQQLTQIEQKSKTSFSVQVSEKKQHRITRRSFNIKTEPDVEQNTQQRAEYNLWKEKWLRSSHSYQKMMEKLKKIYEHLMFTKNCNRACDNLKQMIKEGQIIS